MKTLLLSAAFLAVVAISAGSVSAHKVRTHDGSQSVDSVSSVAFRPESAVQGYVGHGKKVVGYDEFGQAIVGSCNPDYGC